MSSPEIPDRLRLAYERSAAAIDNSRHLEERCRVVFDGGVKPREPTQWTATPVFDNLEVIANADYGLPSPQQFLTDVRNTLRVGRKAVIAPIGPSGAGKSTIIMDLLVKLGQLREKQRIGEAVISSEHVYDLAREYGVMRGEHGQYSAKDYDKGSKMLVKATEMALKENDLVFIDTPSTTGGIFEFPDGVKRQLGKNRGTSTLEELAKESGDDFDLYVIAVVPGKRKIIRSLRTRRMSTRAYRPESVNTFLRKEPDDPTASQPGASPVGMKAINYEIDNMLLTLYLHGMIDPGRRLRLPASLGYFPRNLNSLPDIREELLGEHFYPYFLDSLGVLSSHALIVKNESITPPPGLRRIDRRGLYEEHSYVHSLPPEKRQLLLPESYLAHA